MYLTSVTSVFRPMLVLGSCFQSAYLLLFSVQLTSLAFNHSSLHFALLEQTCHEWVPLYGAAQMTELVITTELIYFLHFPQIPSYDYCSLKYVHFNALRSGRLRHEYKSATYKLLLGPF